MLYTNLSVARMLYLEKATSHTGLKKKKIHRYPQLQTFTHYQQKPAQSEDTIWSATSEAPLQQHRWTARTDRVAGEAVVGELTCCSSAQRRLQ
jgi:hypothetical protein